MTEPYNPTKTPLTVRENELLIIALQCLEGGEIRVDYDKFSTMAGYDNKQSAITILGKLIRAKMRPSTIDSFYVPSSAGTASASPKKSASPKSKTSCGDSNEQDDDGSGGAVKMTSKKRTKKDQGGEPTAKRSKKSSVKVEEEQQDKEADEGGAAVKQEAEGKPFQATVESGEDMEA